MILLTGGAGFIGSALHASLARRGERCTVVDWMGTDDKWRNLRSHPPEAILRPEQLDAYLDTGPSLDAIVHLGAISATTATDADLVWTTNVDLSQRLWRWCAAHGTRFLYASSASTYGDGAHGFDDDPTQLDRLVPLNLYGWSKHAFDRSVMAALARGEATPPQWAALKFFNVYGPNEYHKGSMISVVKRKWDELRAGAPATLFRSDRPDIADGEQRRDFIWVGDAVDILLWLLDHPQVSGLFNAGSGRARTYRDMARAVCAASGRDEAIAFVPMPQALHGHYQSFTEARMDRLRAAGYPGQFTPLEDGIARYAAILAGADPYL